MAVISKGREKRPAVAKGELPFSRLLEPEDLFALDPSHRR
jgi:hypothetical protein